MATITINIPDNKIDNYAQDLSGIFGREDGVTDAEFIKSIILTTLQQLRKTGKRKRVANAVTIPEGDVS